MGNVVQIDELQSIKGRFTLEGKKTIVTGASGGIGRTTAMAFAELGADVALLDINIEKSNEYAEYIKNKYGVKTIAIKTDVSDMTSVKEMMAIVLKEFGTVDTVHSNAGIIMPDDNGDMPITSWKKMVDVNLTGMFILNQITACYMRNANKSGCIINTASMSGHVVTDKPCDRYSVCYTSTKAGVLQLTKSMAMDFSKYGIRINSVSPGFMFSGIHDNMPKETLELRGKSVPAGRFGSMDEIGGIVAFLASDLASYITGTDVIVDGGYCCR
ncbi:MAG: SDR family oxidoreductase [Sedimentibacter sp.]